MNPMLIAAIAAATLVASCGGGADTDTADLAALSALEAAAASRSAIAPERQRALASGSSYSTELAAQLFALAESNYRAYFPSKQLNRNFDGWSYRYYPETGVYLAVIESGKLKKIVKVAVLR